MVELVTSVGSILQGRRLDELSKQVGVKLLCLPLTEALAVLCWLKVCSSLQITAFLMFSEPRS